MATMTGLNYTPTSANTNMPTFSGDVSGYLGKQLTSGDQNSLNSSFGFDPARSNYEFQDKGGNIYSVNNNNNGTRSVGLTDTVANRQNQASQQNFGNLVNASNSAITDFLGNYKSDVGNAITNANNTFNLPTLENTVTGLTSRINDLSNNTSNSGGGAAAGTGLGGYSSEAQVGANLNNRELPALNAASANLNTGEALGQQQIANALAPDQAFQSLLGTEITNAMQGLTATQQTEMNGIIAKISAGATVTAAELQTGEAYAQTILTNANNITLQNLKNQSTPIPQNNTIVNPTTGQVINPTLLANENGGIYTPQ